MSWESTHRYYQALREVEAELDRRNAIDNRADLPWRAEYAQIFGDRDGLLLALRRRWQLLVQAQVEQPYDPSGVPTAALLAVAARHRGLITALRQANETAAPSPHPRPALRGEGQLRARPSEQGVSPPGSNRREMMEANRFAGQMFRAFILMARRLYAGSSRWRNRHAGSRGGRRTQPARA